MPLSTRQTQDLDRQKIYTGIVPLRLHQPHHLPCSPTFCSSSLLLLPLTEVPIMCIGITASLPSMPSAGVSPDLPLIELFLVISPSVIPCVVRSRGVVDPENPGLMIDPPTRKTGLAGSSCERRAGRRRCLLRSVCSSVDTRPRRWNSCGSSISLDSIALEMVRGRWYPSLPRGTLNPCTIWIVSLDAWYMRDGSGLQYCRWRGTKSPLS